MKATTVRLTLSVASALALVLSASSAMAAPLTWTVDSAQSFVRLNIPDSQVTLDGIAVNVRIRNQDNSNWSDAGGRRAFLDGTISTDYVDGSSISFLSGQHALAAIEAGSFRPNPAAFDPGATNGDNPDGSYTNSSGAPAAYAAKVRAQGASFPANLLGQLDLGYIAFRDVNFDVDSGALALDGGGSFVGGSNNFGIASANLDVDGQDVSLVGQVVPDMLNESLTGLTGLNTAGGTVTVIDALTRQLVFNVNVPISIDLDGTILNATASGQIVAFAIVPEPSSIALAGFGVVGLVTMAYRRRRNG